MDKNAKIQIGIATLLIAVLMATLALHFTAAQAGPSVSSGYTIDGNSVYWEMANKGRITVTPHTARGKNVNSVMTQTIEFDNYFGEDKELSCGFVFNEKPRLAKLARLVDANISKSLTKENIISFDSTSEPCEIGNEHNPNKKLVTYAQFPGQANQSTEDIVACYYDATDLGGDTWQIDYWTDGEVANDVTSSLTKGKKDGKFYGYTDHTFKANTAEKFLISYIMNESETEDGDGKRKWEMWCWDGSLNSLDTFLLKLDPWSKNRGDYIFYDNGDDGGDGISPSSGEPVGNHGWSRSTLTSTNGWLEYLDTNTTVRYISNETFGNMTIWAVKYQINSSTVNLTGNRTNVTFQMSYYDDGLLGPSNRRHEWVWFNTVENGVNAPGTEHAFGFYYPSCSGSSCHSYMYKAAAGTWAYTPVSRSVGWHNFTYYQNGSNSILYIDKTEAHYWDDGEGILNFQIYSGDDANVWVDNVMVWEGRPEDRPTAEGESSANETDGRTAIESGIAASTASSGTIYTDKQIYIYYLNGTQKLGTFDKVLSQGDQRWLFNYNTTGESYTNMEGVGTTIHVWENVSLTTVEITAQVKGFINSTDT